MTKKIKRRVKESSKKKTTAEKQFFALAILIVALTLIIIFVPQIYHNFFEKFEYGGVGFEKIRVGKIDFYHGIFPVNYLGERIVNYNIYLRNDPRKNNIPINTQFSLSKNVTISLSEEVEGCREMMLGQSEIGKFFSVFPWVKKVGGGVLEEDAANRTGFERITCANATVDRTVIVIKKSATESIDRGENENCFVLNVGECKYLETVERFIVGIMAQINEVKI